MSDEFNKRQNLILPPHLHTSKIDITRASKGVIAQCIVIAHRARAYIEAQRITLPDGTIANGKCDAQAMAMDLAVIHTHGTPMRLRDMVEGDIERVVIDLIDIHRNVIRYDGQLPSHIREALKFRELLN